MSINDIINWFSSNLFMVIKDNVAYIFDSFRMGDKEYDYGIFDTISVDDLKAGKFSIDSIPDVYIDGSFDFLLDDDLKNSYRISEDVIDKLRNAYFSDYPQILKDAGYNVSADFDFICNFVSGKNSPIPMTETEIQSIISHAPSKYELSCITNYQMIAA